MKILFVLKRKEDLKNPDMVKTGLQTGLYNSAGFVVNMLNKNNIETKMVVVVDNNDIDREVNSYKPDYVIIEAMWVVPHKFTVLTRLHPKVKWMVRIHSDIPFMAQEGIAMDWICDYSDFKNLIIAPNSPKMFYDVQAILRARGSLRPDNLVCLENYYPTKFKKPKVIDRKKGCLDISCFGAIRPLKNQLIQAIAAIDFCNKLGIGLNFHVNGERYETNGMPVFHSLRDLFKQLDADRYQMILHPWVVHEDFVKTCGEMDMGLQVSFSETFNIVSADLTSQGVPVIGSKEIPWLTDRMKADFNQRDSIVKCMMEAYDSPVINTENNQYNLKKYSEVSERDWVRYFGISGT